MTADAILDRAPAPEAATTNSAHRGGTARTVLVVLIAAAYAVHASGPGGFNVSAGDPLVAVLTCVAAGRFLAGGVTVPRYAPHAFAFLTVVAASLTVNALVPAYYFSGRAGALEAVKFVAAACWMAAVAWVVGDDPTRRFTQLTRTSLVVATGFAAWTVVDNLFRHAERPSGPFANPNIYGNYLVMNVFFALGVGRILADPEFPDAAARPRRARRLRLLLRVVVVPTLLLGLLATGSRGALVGLAAGLILSAGWWRPRRLDAGRLGAFVVGGAVLAAAVLWFFDHNPYVTTRVARTTQGDPNVLERLALWRAARDAFSANPLFGIGYGQFPPYASLTHGLNAKVTHQTYLSAAAELGLGGVVALLWLLGSVLRDAWRARSGPYRHVAAACAGTLVATFAQGFFANVDQFRSLWITFGITSALLHAERRVGVRSRGRAAAGAPPSAARAAALAVAAPHPSAVGGAGRDRHPRRGAPRLPATRDR
jgi:hypothetical protein